MGDGEAAEKRGVLVVRFQRTKAALDGVLREMPSNIPSCILSSVPLPEVRREDCATMHIPRKPSNRIEADRAGNKLYIVARDTGEAIPFYLFVGVLPFSMYAYAEGCLRMDMESWIVHDSYTIKIQGANEHRQKSMREE